MSAKDFKFVSPGVYIEEIDNSQVPRSPIAIGPLVIGRSRRGPAFQPVRVDSFSEFITIFGNPVAGEEASDLWRGGIPTAPTFAAYAAQAWLKNSSPLTFIRLLGEQSPDQDGTTYAQAGWKSSNVVAPAASADQGGGAYGLFLFNSSSSGTESVDGTLAAVFYVTEGAVTLSGSIRGRETSDTEVPNLATTTGSAAMVYSGDGTFNVQFYNKDETLQEEAVINMDRANQNYIRKVLNTNPTLTNSALVDSTSASQKKYWLGQTFEREVSNKITSSGKYGMILRLGRSSSDISNAGDYKFSSQAARSGWFFSQDIRSTSADTTDTSKNIPQPMYDPASLSGVTKLFRLHGLSAGEDVHRNFKVCIEDIKYSSNDNTPYGSFTLAIRDIKDSDNSVRYVERYANLSLDPNSPNYIAKQIGDRYHEWDTNQRRLIEYGSYENRSSIFRVEMADAVHQSQTDPELLPFGVEGPIKFGDFVVTSDDSSGTQAATATIEVLDSGVSGAPLQNIKTGTGAIISRGENNTSPSNGGIFVSATARSGLNTNSITVQFPGHAGIGFVDSAGAALSNTHTITLSNVTTVDGTSPGAYEVIVSCQDGSDGDLTAGQLAKRIANVFNKDSSLTGMGASGDQTEMADIMKFGASWQLGTGAVNTFTAGGEIQSVLEGSVVNTSGVKIQARGSQATHSHGGNGRFGGPLVTDDTDWKVNTANAGLVGGSGATGDQGVTAGSSTAGSDAEDATIITIDTAGDGAETLTANEVGSNKFVIGAVTTKNAAGDSLQVAINAMSSVSATDDNAGLVTVTNTTDTGTAGNAATIKYENTTSGAFKIQGAASATTDTENFIGGSNDGDFSNGNVVKSATDFAAPDSPVAAGSGSAGIFMAASASNADAGTGQGILLQYSGRAVNVPFTGSVSFPSIPLRVSASDGDLGDSTEAYFGAQFARAASSVVFEESNFDITYPVAKASAFSPSSTAAGGLVTSWYFSLDDLVAKYKTDANARDVVFYASGSRSTGGSVTAISGSYKKILDMGYDRFSAAFYGGFDGFDIAEKEPFNASRAMQHGTATELNSAMFYSAKKAVDMFSDPEYIESNILTFPGMINEGITTHMITTCESRGDALALIDPRGGYTPASENYESEQTRIVTGLGRGGVARHVTDVADKLDLRNLNSSYGAAYYPWVRITDTITGRNLWAPPSLAAFGAMAYSEKQSALWFAPAGFNRGGLTEGAAGLPVTNVRSRLTSKERDYLYERNINPIASFPNEGIVIFGQKTLQITPSALDRINVRRLMIFVKKEISRIASQLLFDQNVEQTWSRFTGQVNPFLTNIKNNFGLDAFKVILDETTTTPDLIDRNTIYAKIFLKPTKAVEFFAIDFVITNSGAGFED